MKIKHIKSWGLRCEEEIDPTLNVTHSMIQEKMQKEIDELREVYEAVIVFVKANGRYNTEMAYRNLEALVKESEQ